MRLFLTTCFLFFAILCSQAQTNKVLSGDTTFWRKIKYESGSKIGLQDLISSTIPYHFRFWKRGQIADIWTINGISFNGSVVSYINSYETYESEKRSQKKPKFFFERIYLDSITVKKAIELIQHVAKIPTDKSIKGWQQGFDGLEYSLETATPTTYDFRNYWTPTAQDSSLLEAKQIQAFVNDLDTLLGMRNKYGHFFESLKPGTYTNDGPWVTIKMTDKQKADYKKATPYREYLNSMADTLTNYLNDTITKAFSKYGDVSCYDEFFLKFSKENKLLKVTTNSKLDDKEDKKEYLNCRKKIVKAFKQIKVDFVHSEVPYVMILRFSNGKAIVHNSFY